MSLEQLLSEYEKVKAKNLALDMTRGKPGPEQLDLSNSILNLVTADDYKTAGNADPRNYGGLDGIPETKALFKEFLEVSSLDEVIVGGNSSLTMMHDTIRAAVTHGTCDGKPWGSQKAKFICPSPGYDRHFAICEHFGIEMITTSYTSEGPNVEEIEKLVTEDESIKGVWIVPKYGNPTGISCSAEVVDRLAKMKTAAKDFRIFWDNAYGEHHIVEKGDELKNILEACKAAGNENRPFIFASTSKITFAGSGVAAMGGSVANMNWMRDQLFFSTIGPDKINQIRHNRFFGNFEGLQNHMKKHAEILKPKFDKTLEILEKELGGTGLASWTEPKGGYFISLDTPTGTAKEVVALADAAGVKLTGAGATFPYKKDPNNCNIRLAPSLPSVAEIEEAMKIVCLCVKIAAAKK